ncbi:MAG: DUF4236 domain-containing protein [Pyramidobacter sp.]|nr:DUF4236 domain-containing protein [Pyramidobacter sp.]
MGLRFRKSITLIPGLVTLNISKTGVSLSLGPRGKSISVGTGGVYGNIGLGKGMSYRKKLTDLLPKGEGTKKFKTYLKYVMMVIIALYVLYQYAGPFISKIFAPAAK